MNNTTNNTYTWRHEFFDSVWEYNYITSAGEEGMHANKYIFDSAKQALSFLKQKGITGDSIAAIVETYFAIPGAKSLAIIRSDNEIFVI